MKYMQKPIIWSAAAIVAWQLVVPPRAYCYIDPGAGSILLQMILGGIGGVWLLFKAYGKDIKMRLRAFFRR